MGMAASQARFLGLTARKNNVEYEGQQINQQRTTLSNQSANYYNDLLGMSVPVPPSVDDYTKTVYTFTDGALTNQITAMIAKGNNQYTVSYTRQWKDDFSVISAATSIVTSNEDKSRFYIGATELRTIGDLSYTIKQGEDDPGQTAYYNIEDDKYYSTSDFQQGTEITIGEDTEITVNSNDDYLKTLSVDQLEKLQKEEKEYLQLLQAKYGAGDYMIRYKKNSTTGEYVPYFYKKDDLEAATYDDKTGNSQSNINCYTIGAETKSEEVKAVEGCEIEKDSSGRYINITFPGVDGEPATTYALTTTSVKDEDAYEDAMNQYEFDKQQYDQAIDEINAKIEIIQSQDKNLELRLKQLDTEQDAISTEIEAVQKVIEKNTESSFKTFG